MHIGDTMLKDCKLKYSPAQGWCCYAEVEAKNALTNTVWKRVSDYFESEIQTRHWAVNNGYMIVGKM